MNITYPSGVPLGTLRGSRKGKVLEKKSQKIIIFLFFFLQLSLKYYIKGSKDLYNIVFSQSPPTVRNILRF